MKGFLFALISAVLIAAGGIVYLLFFQADIHAPAIIVLNKDPVYTGDMGTEDLLNGVIAIDDFSGDVTGTLTVDNIEQKDDGTMDVTYRASDRRNNVAVFVYTYRTGEGSAPEEAQAEAAAEPAAAEQVQALALSPEGQALSDAARAEEEAKIAELSPLSPRIYLTQYYTEVLHGTEFAPLDYVGEIEDDVDARDLLFTRIQIHGTETLSMDVPGSYTLTYFVMDSEGHQSNMANLTVRVL